MNQKKLNESDQPDHLQAKSDGLAAGNELVPSPPKEESRNLLGPHRRQDEPWDHYINRRINDAPDAAYQDRHQKVQDWVKRHSLPEGVTPRSRGGRTRMKGRHKK